MGVSRASLPLALLAAAVLLLLAGPSVAARPPRGLRRHSGGAARLCRRTDYPALCLSAAKSFRGASPAALTKATILAAIQKTHEGRALVTKLFRGRRPNGNVETCRQTYESALSDLQTSLNALNRNSIADLQINLSAVISDVGTCDDGYAETAARRRSPFAGVGNDIRKLASNGLALSQMMKRRR